MLDHLPHRTAGCNDLIGRQALTQQIFPCDCAIGQVDIRRMIDNSPVDLFRHPEIEAAISRLNMKDWNLATLGGDCRETAVGIAQYQNSVGRVLLKNPVDIDDDAANRFSRILSGRIEKGIRLPDLKLPEEDLVQFIVEILPRMHKDVISILVEFCDDTGQPDDLRPCPDDRHNLKHFYGPA